MSSPLLWGPNGTASNLQNQILQANGSLLQSNGPRNYIGYNNFENQATTGWSLGTTGTLTNGIPTGTPTFGSGAAGTLSLAASTSSPIAGTASLSLVSSAATTAGNMFASDLLPIDTADQAKVLTYTFYYTVPTGVTNANFSGTSSNSYGIACYDVTNSSWLPVVGNFAMTQNSGVGIATGTMQTNITTANVRFIVYCVNATAGAVTVNFDRFYLGPQTAPIGAVMTDWQSYSLTISAVTTPPTKGTVSVDNAQWRRVGDSMEIDYQFRWTSAGTSGSGTYLFSLPPGYAIDTSKIKDIVNPGTAVGVFSDTGSGIGNFTGVTLIYDSTHLQLFESGGNLVSSTRIPLSTVSGGYSFTALVPIVGWSSQVQMSSDTTTAVVSTTLGMLAASTAVSANAAVKFDTVFVDNTTSYAAATGLFTAPVTGFYRISSSILISGATTSFYASVNGALTRYILSAAAGLITGGSTTVSLKAGDTLSVRPDGATTIVGSSVYQTNVAIERLSGPAVIAATETVAASYTTANTTVLFAGSNSTQIPFTAKVLDTHSAYNTSTGSYVLPATGTYSVQVNAYAAPTTGNWALVIYQNSTQVGYGTIGNGIQSQAFATVNGLAGDVISIRGNANSGSGNCTFGLSSTSRDQLSITRIK